MFNKYGKGVRGLAILATAAVTAFGISGCNNAGSSTDASGPATITFQWWGNDERAKLTEQAVDLFEQANPDITVNTSYSTIDAYIPKLATQIAGGGAPDLFLVPMESVREYASKKALTPLTDYLGSTIRTDNISKSTLDIGTVDGEVVGITLGLASSAMVYNPTVWKEAGAEIPGPGFTWDDLREAGAKIRDSSGGKTAALSDPGGAILWFEAHLLQNGKELYTDDGKIGFTKEDLAEWWELTSELRESGVTTDAETTSTIDQSMQNSGLARGLSAAEFAAASLTDAYATTIGPENVALAPFPTFTDISGMYMNGQNEAAISSKSSHKQAAAKLLDFLLNDPEAGKVLGLTRGISPNTETYKSISSELKGGQKMVSDFVAQHEKSFVAPPPLAPAGASVLPAAFTLAYEQVSFGQTDIDKAAEQLVATFESSIR
ncbi:ABC transporter substrate-binding protein [Pseudarthrobacter scleromae]|uniref:ABC transporter substrate-binding protein n=1 Tax=Pseudarthrobacter scleromae TaxID=158897 RepID=UPI003636EFDF